MAYNKVNAKNDYQIGVSAMYQKLNYFAYKWVFSMNNSLLVIYGLAG